MVLACVLWRRRQRRRARVLARQLTATQRRIDTLKTLRRKAATSSTRTDYRPPADLQASLSSIDDVSLRRVRSARTRPGHFTLSLSQPPVHSSEVFKSPPSLPPPASENDTSFQCSTCPGGTDLAGGHDPTDSSMAVECDTTRPTISPVSAVRTTRRGSHRPPPRQRISDSSAIATSNAGTWGSSSTLQPSTTHIDHSTPTLWPPRGSSPLLEDVTSDPTQQGRPTHQSPRAVRAP